MDAILDTYDAVLKGMDRATAVVLDPGAINDRIIKLEGVPTCAANETMVFIDNPTSAGSRGPRVAQGRRRCAICGRAGHDKRTCPEGKQLGKPTSSRRHCSVCGSSLHDRRTCPSLGLGEQEQDVIAVIDSPGIGSPGIGRRAAGIAAGVTARVNDLTGAQLFLEQGIERSKTIVGTASTEIDRLNTRRADFVFGTWLIAHLTWPYPTLSEAVDLGLQAGRAVRATQTWFSRARRDLRWYVAQSKATPSQCIFLFICAIPPPRLPHRVLTSVPPPHPPAQQDRRSRGGRTCFARIGCRAVDLRARGYTGAFELLDGAVPTAPGGLLCGRVANRRGRQTRCGWGRP